MERKDFKSRLPYETDWKEVLWQHNTDRGYQHKQDLVAVFLGLYLEIERKFIPFFNEFSEIPSEVFNDLIFKFRQSFPKHNRIEGINYFDDLIELLIQKYSSQKDEADKGCKSLTRARAFFIMEMYKKGKIFKTDIESKKKIIEIVKKEFSDQSGKTVYDILKTGENLFYNTEDQKNKHPEDYEYGLKLYKKKFPD